MPDRQILISSLKVAAVVGTLLNLINQYRPLIEMNFGSLSYRKLLHTYCVPFLVSLYSAASVQKRNAGDNNSSPLT